MLSNSLPVPVQSIENRTYQNVYESSFVWIEACKNIHLRYTEFNKRLKKKPATTEMTVTFTLYRVFHTNAVFFSFRNFHRFQFQTFDQNQHSFCSIQIEKWAIFFLSMIKFEILFQWKYFFPLLLFLFPEFVAAAHMCVTNVNASDLCI